MLLRNMTSDTHIRQFPFQVENVFLVSKCVRVFTVVFSAKIFKILNSPESLFYGARIPRPLPPQAPWRP